MKRLIFAEFQFFCIFGVFGVLGVFSTCIFFGDPGMGKIHVFFDLSGPRVPGDPMVGPHIDCVAFWDTVEGIQALDGPQGPPQTGLGVAQDGPVEVLAALQGKFGWKTVKNL